MSPLPSSLAVLMWREMPVFRAFLYITFRVPSKESTLQLPLTELPLREMIHFQSPPSNIRVPSKRTLPMVLNGAPMETDARLQSLLQHISTR
jgi:hypothetical protein